jgi:hypothetical protein
MIRADEVETDRYRLGGREIPPTISLPRATSSPTRSSHAVPASPSVANSSSMHDSIRAHTSHVDTLEAVLKSLGSLSPTSAPHHHHHQPQQQHVRASRERSPSPGRRENIERSLHGIGSISALHATRRDPLDESALSRTPSRTPSRNTARSPSPTGGEDADGFDRLRLTADHSSLTEAELNAELTWRLNEAIHLGKVREGKKRKHDFDYTTCVNK